MKYKLLKDTPTIKAGTIFEEVASDFNQWKELVRIAPIGAKTSPQFTIQDIDNFDEWFEEIKEPTSGILWKPKKDGKYYCLGNNSGRLFSTFWTDTALDDTRLKLGNVYSTMEEAEQALGRKLAEVRLRRTSTFEPDFENGEGGWTVFFSYMHKELHPIRESYSDSGEPVRYATEEEAKKSIKENREDWLTYFGVKE